MYVLDTDICSYIIRKHPVSALKHFEKTDGGKLGISVITQAEMLYGAIRSGSRISRKVIDAFISRLRVWEWDSEATERYAELRAHLEMRGTPIGAMDLMIAAHALSLDATVVTNNARHFKAVPKLKTVNWV